MRKIFSPTPRPRPLSAFPRSPPPAFPHYSPPSLPTILPALPSPPGPSVRRFLCDSLSPEPQYSPHPLTHSPPAQILHHSPTLPAPAPQTPSSSATPPDRSTQTASKIPSTSCTKSAAPSLPSVPPS